MKKTIKLIPSFFFSFLILLIFLTRTPLAFADGTCVPFPSTIQFGVATPVTLTITSDIDNVHYTPADISSLDSVEWQPSQGYEFDPANGYGDIPFNENGSVLMNDGDTFVGHAIITEAVDLADTIEFTLYRPNMLPSYAWCYFNFTSEITPTPTPTPTPDPVTVRFNPSGDTHVKSGQDNHNYGAGTFMNLQSSGSNRALVKFDQSNIASTIGSGTILSAKLQLTITDNGNNWGTTGRTVDLHRMIAAWDEGNGTENNRGTGIGNTWSCASDSNIANQAKNCSGSTEWEMGQPNNPSVHPWNATASDTKTITNNESGAVEFDVTNDVTSFMNGTNNYGWLVKKTNEGQNGQVSFGTKESSSVPHLVVTYQP